MYESVCWIVLHAVTMRRLRINLGDTHARSDLLINDSSAAPLCFQTQAPSAG